MEVHTAFLGVLIVYGLGAVAAWLVIVRLVQGTADPMPLRRAWLPAAAYAVCWPVVGLLTLLVTGISRLRR